MGRTLYLPIILAAAMVAPASAQLLSNATLTGAYHFRYLGALTDPSDSARSFQGTITFDGNGAYTVTGQGASGAMGGLQPLPRGTYNVGSGGLFFMTNPVDSSGNTFLYGGVGIDKVVVASSTDTLYCDTFVAFPASTAASNATLSGNYRVAHLEFLNGSFVQNTRNTLFSITANGSGSLGDVTIRGTAQNLQSAATTQTSLAATYTVTANGTGTLNLPAPTGQTAANTLLAGNKTLYVSPDGNLFVAGSATGFDMVIGVKAYSGGAPNTALSGLFFTTLLENYAPDGTTALYSAQGASNMIAGRGIELGHQRTNPDGFASYDWTYSGGFTFNADATFTQTNYAAFALGVGGNYVLGSGDGTNYQLNLYVKAATVGGTGVFLNPQGMVNAATFIPFTAQVAPGEFVTLFGSGFGGQVVTADSLPFPTSLGGVQVTVNGTPAPLYRVTPTTISLVIPYSAPEDGSFVRFQVTSGGTASNTVETYSGLTSPGIFTLSQDGLGPAAVTHANFQVVSNDNPARPGETVLIFLTGLGKVSGNVAAGAAGPRNPLATVLNNLAVYIDDIAANVSYKGLAPDFAGLYQLNVTIPANVSAGDLVLDVETVDAVNFQATIRVAR